MPRHRTGEVPANGEYEVPEVEFPKGEEAEDHAPKDHDHPFPWQWLVGTLFTAGTLIVSGAYVVAKLPAEAHAQELKAVEARQDASDLVVKLQAQVVLETNQSVSEIKESMKVYTGKRDPDARAKLHEAPTSAAPALRAAAAKLLAPGDGGAPLDGGKPTP